MSGQKAVWLSAFRYVVPADFEAYMEKMAGDGWNVEKVGQWSSLRMVFHKTQPRNYRYIFDINAFPKKDYRETYEQFGWEFVGQMASCFLWRKAYSGERPESFSDRESLERRNKNVFYAVSICFFLFLAMFAATAVVFGLYGTAAASSDVIQFVLGMVLLLAFLLYLGWVMQKIYKNRDR